MAASMYICFDYLLQSLKTSLIATLVFSLRCLYKSTSTSFIVSNFCWLILSGKGITFVNMTAVNVTKSITCHMYIYSLYCSSILSRFVSILTPFANFTLWKPSKKNYVGIHMEVWKHQLKYIKGWNLLYSVNFCFLEMDNFSTTMYMLMISRGGTSFTL